MMSIFNPAQLIEEVKRRPGLYKADQPADREEKLQLWKDVGSCIYHDWASFSKAMAYDKVLQLQRKWRSLKDAYNRELRARRSGIRIHRRVYRYFKRMSFLGGYEGTISEDDSANEDIASEYPPNAEDDHDLTTMTHETIDKPVKIKKVKRRKRKREPSEDSQLPPEELEMPMFPMEIPENEGDSDRLFLLSFLPEMRQLPVNIKMWTRAQIANVMQEAVACHYNNTMPGTSNKGCVDVKRQRQDSTE